jgi:hypothetical protein
MRVCRIFFLSVLSLSLSFAENISLPDNEQKQLKKISKTKCRIICDKKAYKEEQIAAAIEFYKNSKEYNFKKNY